MGGKSLRIISAKGPDAWSGEARFVGRVPVDVDGIEAILLLKIRSSFSIILSFLRTFL